MDLRNMPTDPNLTLEIDLPDAAARLDRPYPIIVRLTNHSAEPVLVNHRMAVGYRDHLARELFAELLDSASGEPAPLFEVDYNRDFSTPEDYQALNRGESIQATFDLLDWYRPIQPGTYKLVVFYQADEPLARPPAGTLRGIFSSAPQALQILPGDRGLNNRLD
jgi:hypothetical protein